MFTFRVLICSIALALPLAAHSQSWSVTDLGTLGGATSTASAINSAGQVVGQADTANGSRAFLYTPGSGMIDLGTFGGDYSYATGINNSGQVVGGAFTAGQAQVHAFVYTALGGKQDLAVALGGDYVNSSVATGINRFGVVSGSYSQPGPSHAFVYSPAGGLQNIGAFGGVGAASTDSASLGINDSGQVVGRSDFGSTNSRAVIYTPGTGLLDLGTFGGATSLAVGINNGGQVVGRAALANGVDHAFLYSPGQGMLDIGAALGNSKSSVATAINNTGSVVGGATFAAGLGAFLYSTATGLVDLNALLPAGAGWHLDMARGINDSGQIVGTGTINGQQRAFLLSPVPENETWAMLLAGLAFVGVAVRARKATSPLL